MLENECGVLREFGSQRQSSRTGGYWLQSSRLGKKRTKIRTRLPQEKASRRTAPTTNTASQANDALADGDPFHMNFRGQDYDLDPARFPMEERT